MLLCGVALVLHAVLNPLWPRAWILTGIPVVCALGCAVIPSVRGIGVSARWSWRRDGAILLGVAFGGVALWTLALAPPRLPIGPLTASDFYQYCQVVIETPLAKGHHNRPESFAWLPRLFLDDLGVVGSLGLAALVWSFVLCAGLYIWGRSLHGPVAGVTVVLMASALGPVVVLSRTVTAYPQGVATSVLAMALAVAAWRFRHPFAFLLAGLGVLACLLTQQSAVFTAVPAVSIALVGVAGIRSWRAGLSSLVLLLVPVGAAWALGTVAFPEPFVSLDAQLHSFYRDGFRLAGEELLVESPGARGWVWGRPAGLGSILETRARIQELAGAIPSGGLGGLTRHATGRQLLLQPWFFPACVGAVFVALRMLLRGRVVALTVLAVSVSPFLTSLKTVHDVLPMVRFIAGGLPAIALILGLAFALVIAPDEDLSRRVDLRSGLRVVTGLVVLFVCVDGLVDSWLNPYASWRMANLGNVDPTESIEKAVTAPEDPCQRHMAEDLDRLGWIEPAWYPQVERGR